MHVLTEAEALIRQARTNLIQGNDMTIDDPTTLLRAHQRAALDRQAELATEARALAQRVEQVAAEMAELKPIIDKYNAILGVINAATAHRAKTNQGGMT